MGTNAESRAERARTASLEEIPLLLYENDPHVLAALLENPRLEESHLVLLLERKELSGEILEVIARNKGWLRSYRLRRGLAFHAHTPRLVAMRLARDLYLMDLVQLSFQPGVPGDLRRLAEELILARIPQLPLGQKLTLARRAPARVVGSLLAEGHPQVIPPALDNAFLTEAQVLKVLARENVSERVVLAIAKHLKWSHAYTVRLALLRHPLTPLDRILAFLPDLTQRDLEDLAETTALPARLREYVRTEVARRRAATEAKPPRRTS
jgi:hypothetical protein